MVRNVNIIAGRIAPNPKEVMYWVDLSADPTGKVIKVYNGRVWLNLYDLEGLDLTEITDLVEQAKDAASSISDTVTEINAKIDAEATARAAADAELNAAIEDLEDQISSIETGSGSSVSVPTKVSELENDANYVTASELEAKGYQTAADCAEAVAALVDSAPETLDTLNELAAALGNDANFATTVSTQLGQKLDVTTYEADKATFALKTEVPTNVSELTNDSGYITSDALTDYAKTSDIPTNVSALMNDAGYITSDAIASKQDVLVSGVNIKTINSQSLLGEGNIEITTESGGITDAPSDGNTYGRKDGSWTTIESVDLSNYALKSEIPTVPTNVSAFTNDAGYLTSDNLSEYAKTSDIPTKVSDLDNDSGYITAGYLTDYATTNYVDQAIAGLSAGDIDLSSYLTKSEASTTYQPVGDYALSSDLPTNVSQLTNDSGYITSSDLADYAKLSDIPDTSSFVTNTSLESTLTSYAKTTDLPDTSDMLTKTEAATTYQLIGDYALKNEIPTIPTTVSSFTNDAGYITESNLSGYAKTEDIPTKVSELENDAYYTDQEYVAGQIDGVTLYLDAKQDKLVSGTNIKTINGESVLGSGDIVTPNTTYDVATTSTSGLMSAADKTKLDGIAEGADVTNVVASNSSGTAIAVINGTTIYAPVTTTGDLDLTAYVTNVELESTLSSYAKTSDIPTVPTNVSAFTNDAGYITDSALSDYAKTTDIPDVSDFVTDTDLESTLADYAKIEDLPDTSSFVTNSSLETTLTEYAKVSDIPDTSSFVTNTSLESTLTSYVTSTTLESTLAENYALKSDIPTNVSQLTNDAGYLVSDDLSEYAKTTDLPDTSDMLTKTEASATYQVVGDYALKSEIPTVPTNVSSFTNDAGYITSEALSDYAKSTDIPDTSDMLTKTEAAGTYLTIGDYALKSEIPTVPSNVSAFTNDSGYITSSALTDYVTSSELEAKGYQTESQCSSAIDTAIANLVNSAPETLDTLLELAAALGNDANFATTVATQLGQKVDTTTYEADKTTFALKTELPTNVSDLTNDAGYITSSALSGYAQTSDIPTNVSELTNDSGYITSTEAANTYQPIGNYATKDEVDSEIDEEILNLLIGGRNYFGFNKSVWTEALATTSDASLDQDINGVTITLTQDSTDRNFRRIRNLQLPETGYYTVSFYARASAECTITSDTCDASPNSGEIDLTTEYKYVTYTPNVRLYVNDGQYYGFVDFSSVGTISSGTTIYIKDFKIEKGTKATDWTPAPEDKLSLSGGTMTGTLTVDSTNGIASTTDFPIKSNSFKLQRVGGSTYYTEVYCSSLTNEGGINIYSSAGSQVSGIRCKSGKVYTESGTSTTYAGPIVVSDDSYLVAKIRTITQTAYDALSTYDSSTLYIITE